MKKIGIIGFIQIIFLLIIIFTLGIFINYKIDLNILAIIVSILSLLITLLNEIKKAIEANKKAFVLVVKPETLYNVDIGNIIEENVNKLRKENRTIDSIKIIDDKDRAATSEIIIIYH